VARSTDQDIVAGAAVEGVVAHAADQNVISVAAINRQQDAAQAGCIDYIVTVEPVDDEPIIGVEIGELYFSPEAGYDNLAIDVGKRDHVVVCGAIN
jgi:hypothetical protein